MGIFRLECYLPNRPLGEEIEVSGLGVVANGGSRQLNEVEVQMFMLANEGVVASMDPEAYAEIGVAAMSQKTGADFAKYLETQPHLSLIDEDAEKAKAEAEKAKAAKSSPKTAKDKE